MSTNFLIGRGELLTQDIKGPRRPRSKAEVYTLAQAVGRLSPQFSETTKVLDALPAAACPKDLAVARLMMNPSYIARSYFPKAILHATGLTSVGSRTTKVTPNAWSKKGVPKECTTTELFIAGRREIFRHLRSWANRLQSGTSEAVDLARVEQFAAFEPGERIVSLGSAKENFFEVGVHLLPDEDRLFVQQAFKEYAQSVGAKLHDKFGFTAGSLWFVPVEGVRDSLREVAKFAFVRVIRPMPRLRGLRPVKRTGGASVVCRLPGEQPLSGEPRVAVLDGGLPGDHPLAPWVRSYRLMDEKAADDPDGPDHGLGVTSALLFGPIEPNSTARRPYTYVDHIRVLDQETKHEDPLELYRTLGFVEEVLLSRQYQFVNLSLGPDLPVEDTNLHAWTSVIDDLLSDGETLMTVAAGNNGELDREAGNARIQVPSDCVNAIAVGAATSIQAGWARAPYSAIGPGRSPGVVKPDLIAFGGSPSNYFHVLASGRRPVLQPQFGTSFASPYLLRQAVGLRAVLGANLTTLAIRALLVHSANASSHDKLEVGWGKVPEELTDIITCPPGVARIVYQGSLKPGKYMRAAVPMPTGGLSGKVKLTATFCYASATDPQDAAAYTRAGLEVTFRPHDKKMKKSKTHAGTKTFFEMKKYATEAERRSDLGKWETTLHASQGMLGSSLNNPVFDIHYNARETGASTGSAEKIPYALIITIQARHHVDLYNDILRAYAKTLVPIQPQVSIPVRV